MLGTRGSAGLAATITISFDWRSYSDATIEYTITVTRVPRPGYNLGGTSQADAPLLTALPAAVKASVHPYEPRQYWKVQLAAGDTLKVIGRVRAPTTVPQGALTYIKVFNAAGSSTTIMSMSVAGGGAWLPLNSSTFTNTTGQSAEFWVAAEASIRLIDAQFTIVQNNILPQLTLFLDADSPLNFDPQVPNPENDIATYVPGARQHDDPTPGGPLKGSSVSLPQSIQIIAAYVDASGAIAVPPTTGDVTFTLNNAAGQGTSSAFQGIAMNASHPTRADNAPDFELTSNTASFGDDNTARVSVSCWDYGGFATVRAIHGAAVSEMPVPRDAAPSNGISDYGWDLIEEQYNGQDFVDVLLEHVDDNGGVADDQDSSPAGARAGDNLSRFEEYRGFFVGGKHRRTGPDTKDVFLFNNSSASYNDVLPIGLRWHPVNTNQISASRRINFNATGIQGHADQQAILVFNGPAVNPLGVGATPCFFQIPFVCYPNIIGITNGAGYETWDVNNNVRVNEDRIRIMSPTNDSPVTPDMVDPEAFRSVLGHELGHSIGIYHNSDLSSIMREELVYNNDWNSIMHAFFSSDLSQITLK
jgi:hypothetical protein